MAALYLEPQSPVNPHTFLGALSLMLGGAAKPILDVAGCATGWGCGGLRADANPLNWAKGIAGAVTSLASDIAHGHFGGAAGTLVGMLAVGGDDPAAGLAPRAITAAPERLALPAAPERLALTAGVGARTTVLGENMGGRVIPYANATGLETLGFGATAEEWAAMTPAQRYALNDRMLRARISAGDFFQYVGQDPARSPLARQQFDLTRSELLRLDYMGIDYLMVPEDFVLKMIGS